jgi:hypothetical protein
MSPPHFAKFVPMTTFEALASLDFQFTESFERADTTLRLSLTETSFLRYN